MPMRTRLLKRPADVGRVLREEIPPDFDSQRGFRRVVFCGVGFLGFVSVYIGGAGGGGCGEGAGRRVANVGEAVVCRRVIEWHGVCVCLCVC